MKEAKFVVLDVIQNDAGTEISPVCISLNMIKSVVKIKEKSKLIDMPTPVIGQCAINLLDSSAFLVNHTFDEVANALGAAWVQDPQKQGSTLVS